MKKSILNLGNTLNKKEQKEINGGKWRACSSIEIAAGCYHIRTGCFCPISSF
ncbi:hypothetical protein [Tenacibaculum halocynthiae]|uniref:hypothetical protein n=1 Tax=Tenacibaculum halocynthiae TaxID=1254437 RepID=UPI00389507D9